MIFFNRIIMLLEHVRSERINVHQHQGSIMMHIIAFKPIEDRSLRRYCLESRMT